MDENFAEIRDICSYYYNGGIEKNSQMEAFLMSLPFTIVYHINGLLLTMIYSVFGGIQADDALETNATIPITISVFVSNIMVVMLWSFGGKVGMVLSTATTIFNQNFYNSLLFRRSFRDFVLSFVFGNLLVIQDKGAASVRATPNAGAYEASVSELVGVARSRGRGLDVLRPRGEKESNSQRTLTKSNKGKDKSVQSTNLPHESTDSATSSGNSIDDRTSPGRIVAKVLSRTQLRNEGENSTVATSTSRSNPSGENSIIASEQDEKESSNSSESIEREKNLSGMQTTHSNLVSEESYSQHRLQHISTIFALGKESLAENASEENATIMQSPRDAPSISKQMANQMAIESLAKNEAVDDLSTDFLNPSDVHIDLDNHPGTVAWRNCISDAVEKFPVKSYTFRKHVWVMKKMNGRLFFVKEDGNQRRKLNRSEIKLRCKIFHERQIELRTQIAGILSDLKDLKKNHSTSKSNSDHSRNSKKSAVPVGTDGNARGILLKDSSIDEVKTDKQKQDAASAAKDSLVESSKESTISTLTQSNPPPSKCSEARSTPWIVGKTEEARDANTTAAKEINSDQLRNAIVGLLQYTAWLENLNPLRENGGDLLEKERSQGDRKEEKKIVIDPAAHQPVDTPLDDVATGGIELVKNKPYWRTLVEEKAMVRKRTVSPSNATQIEGVGVESYDPPKSIHWDIDNKHFIDTADVKSRERRKFFPLWRRALHKRKDNDKKGKRMAEKPDHRDTKPGPTKESRRKGASFWRNKRAIDVVVVDEEQQPRSPEDDIANHPMQDNPVHRTNVVESRSDERDERLGMQRESIRVRRNIPPNRNTKQKLRDYDDSRREAPVLSERLRSMSPYEQILNILDDGYLEKWEGEESFSESGSRPAHRPDDPSELSSYHDGVKKPGGGQDCIADHFHTQCDALHGITGACALRAASHDVELDPLDDDDSHRAEILQSMKTHAFNE